MATTKPTTADRLRQARQLLDAIERDEREPDPIPPELLAANVLTVNETCQYARLSRHTIWELTRTGALPSLKIGTSRRYLRSDLDKFLEGHRIEGVS